MSGMPWGGSEVLWYKAAKQLQREGHDIAVSFKWWPYKAFQLEDLEKGGAVLNLRNAPKSKFQGWISSFKPDPDTPDAWVDRTGPDAVLVTLGYHPDRIPIADACLKNKIPYAINLQCASSFFFIPGDRLEDYRRWYSGAEKVLFVSDENRLKLENNIAMKLDNAEIVSNPFNVDYEIDVPWPEPKLDSAEPVFRVAVVGRVHFQSKGQDIVVDVMKQDKWKNRPVEISFYGHDQGNKAQLESLIEMHGLQDKLKFGGFVKKVTDIWAANHALLLPSRYEGAPLVVTEAMLCGRFAITTNLGRNAELMDDNVSGFIAEGATVSLFDEAMERAWQKRDQWQQIGQLARQHIRERYPEDPIGEYADKVRSLLDARG
jgi:glycosyltransferase involved in cell wall biosynthesis